MSRSFCAFEGAEWAAAGEELAVGPFAVHYVAIAVDWVPVGLRDGGYGPCRITMSSSSSSSARKYSDD